MRLSALQRYILRECYQSGKARVSRQRFTTFYQSKKLPKDAVDSITKSLERLIDKGLMIGYGRRTPEKWFIEDVRLTPTGRKVARTTLGQQQHFRFN